MSNLYNDMVFDELNELDGELSEAQRVDVQKLIDDNDLEKALYMSRWYADQANKAELRAIVRLNADKNRQGGQTIQPMGQDS